jgi:hypothetical protein
MKKALMVLLLILFVLGVATLVVTLKKKVAPMADSLPLPQVSPTPVLTNLLPTPAPEAELINLENDFKRIKEDADKLKEEKRLDPPAFIFDLGLYSSY